MTEIQIMNRISKARRALIVALKIIQKRLCQIPQKCTAI